MTPARTVAMLVAYTAIPILITVPLALIALVLLNLMGLWSLPVDAVLCWTVTYMAARFSADLVERIAE